MCDVNNNIIIDQEKILNLEVNYYKTLYSSTKPDVEDTKKYFNNIKKCPKLSESDLCEGKITVQECTDAIFKMKLNIAPGLDGLNVEFYKNFVSE